MIINFDEMAESINNNFKGGEKTFFAKIENDGINKIMKGRLPQGASIGMHTHYNDSEIIYILEGEGVVIFDGVEIPLRPGMAHYCPKGHDHSLINPNLPDLKFFAVVVTQ